MTEDIIGFFEKWIFLLKGNVFKTKEEKSEEKSEELQECINNTLTFIEEKSEGINHDLFNRYFNFLTPINLAKKIIRNKR